MNSLELALTLFALIAIPLWIFRHDIIAAKRGITYLEYLEQRLEKLNQVYVTGEIKRAGLRHPRPLTDMHRAKGQAVACAIWTTVLVIGVLTYHVHVWAHLLLAAGVGGALGSGARMAWFYRKAKRSVQSKLGK